AAHCRDQERTGAPLLEESSHAAEHDGYIGDAPTPSGQGDALSRPDGALQIHAFKGRANGTGHVVDPRSLELRADSHHFGIKHSGTPRSRSFALVGQPFQADESVSPPSYPTWAAEAMRLGKRGFASGRQGGEEADDRVLHHRPTSPLHAAFFLNRS